MKVALSELQSLSEIVGAQVPFWTQGPGGNVSVKDQNNLWIKASGFRLDSVTAKSGFACVDLEVLRKKLDSLGTEVSESERERLYSNSIYESIISGESLKRPSMETGFHAVLPKRLVMHFHSVVSLLLAHESKANHEKVQQWLRGKWTGLLGDFHFYSPVRPGCNLTMQINTQKNASVHILENHGVVLHSDNPKILENWTQFEKDFCEEWKYPLLLNLLSSPQRIDEVIKKISSILPSCPFKTYFPDTTVFKDSLLKVLQPVQSQHYSFPLSAWKNYSDLGEIWLATQILYISAPNLAELPADLCASIPNLPTEKFRKNR